MSHRFVKCKTSIRTQEKGEPRRADVGKPDAVNPGRETRDMSRDNVALATTFRETRQTRVNPGGPT